MLPLISRPPSSPTVLVNTSFAFWSRWLLSPVTSRFIFEKSSENAGSVPRSMKRSVPSSRRISPIWTSMVSRIPLGLAGAAEGVDEAAAAGVARGVDEGAAAGAGAAEGGVEADGSLGLGTVGAAGPPKALT